MKKKFRLTIASLALCTVSCLALAVATSIKPNKTQTVTAETNVAPISNTYTLADFKIDETAVGISAGTNEGLGYIGEGKGITVYASVLLR